MDIFNNDDISEPGSESEVECDEEEFLNNINIDIDETAFGHEVVNDNNNTNNNMNYNTNCSSNNIKNTT